MTEGQVRKRINTIISDKLYQRGQILTWPREDKLKLIEEKNIQIVVNFWPKIDPDLGELDVWYLYIPTERSINMMKPNIFRIAKYISDKLSEEAGSALILCEAGKTRSVFFCGLILQYYWKSNRMEAYQQLNAHVPDHRLKKFMIEYFTE